MLDVAAAVIAAAEGARARIVGVAVGVLHNAVHLGGQLQLTDPLGLCRDGLLKLVLLELSKLRVDVGVDRAGLLVHLSGQIGRCQTIVAAALCELALDAVSGLEDGGVGASLCQSNLLAELADVALHLIAEIADTVADVGQPVVQLAKLLAVEDLLLRCRGGILAVLAGAVAPEAVATEAVAAHHGHKEEQNQDVRHPVTRIHAVVVSSGDGGDVAKTHIVHIDFLSCE